METLGAKLTVSKEKNISNNLSSETEWAIAGSKFLNDQLSLKYSLTTVEFKLL